MPARRHLSSDARRGAALRTGAVPTHLSKETNTTDLAKLGKDLLADKLGGGAGGVMDGITKLTGGGEGALDLGEIVGKLERGGLGDQVDSRLGDGDNADVSGEELKSALGGDKVAEMASTRGVDVSSATEKRKDVLPGLLDQASSGGSLMDKFSGVRNALEMAKGLFESRVTCLPGRTRRPPGSVSPSCPRRGSDRPRTSSRARDRLAITTRARASRASSRS